jgi:acetoin utilization protein AcuB
MEKKIKLTHSESFYIKKLLENVKLKEIMTENVISLPVEAHFSEVARQMMDNKVRHLPILNKNKEVVGIISQRDLYKIQSPRLREDGTMYYDPAMLDNIILRVVMTQDPVTLTLDDSAAKAVIKMIDHHCGCVPVVDHKNVLCGIITRVDLLRIAAQIIKEGDRSP